VFRSAPAPWSGFVISKFVPDVTVNAHAVIFYAVANIILDFFSVNAEADQKTYI